jgi:hypothetical protein
VPNSLIFQAGLFSIVIFCLINASPHFIYGAGNEALSLTVEFGGERDSESSEEAQLAANKKYLCLRDGKKLKYIVKKLVY